MVSCVSREPVSDATLRRGVPVTVSDASTPSVTVRSELPSGIDPLVWETERQALEQRFAPHLDAAAAEVRAAEKAVQDAAIALARAREDAASQQYQSDRRVFMRASVDEELESLVRKTTEKKLKSGHRYLVARAVELAEAEVAGYRADRAGESRERDHGVLACEQAHHRASAELTSAHLMQERVQHAYLTAERGLVVMLRGGDDSDEGVGHGR